MYSQFKLDMRKNVITVRVANSRSRFPREVVERVPLEIFKNHLAEAIGNTG